MVDSIGFDLDGTLWDYAGQYASIFGEIVRGMDGVHTPSVEEVYAVTGLPAADYVRTLFPELQNAPESLLKDIFGQAEIIGCNRILMQGGRLYDGLEEMLAVLSKKYRLFVASNCEPLYLNNFLEYHKLRGYFTDLICQNATGAKPTKGENIRVVMERNGFAHTVFVGDAQSDADAAAYAKVPFVWASYGYGHVPAAEHRIAAPMELVSLIETIQTKKAK